MTLNGGNVTDQRVRIPGQKMHRDLERDFSFWRPLNWKRYDVAEQHGVVYYPGVDPNTGFYVLVRDLGAALDEEITEADLPALHEGLLEGLRGLPECEILSDIEINKEAAIGFEFTLTFVLDGQRYKRRMRMLYKGRQQFTIYGQGVPPNEYDRFESIYDWMYLTFTFSDLPSRPQNENECTGLGANPRVLDQQI
jgi:hypothetical protein